MILPLFALLTLSAGPVFYVGTYTKPPSEGIYAFRLQQSTGQLVPLGLAAKVSNPSFVAFHPNGKFLYAVNENGQGSVTAFSINRETAMLTQLNSAPTKGDGPCHLAVDPRGKFLIAVNYGGGSVMRIALADDGRLTEPSVFVQHGKRDEVAGADPARQRDPHAHSVNYSPDGKYAFVADLGRDELITYKVDQGGLAPSSVEKMAAGAGPRHFAFHPSHKTAFVINELNSTMTVLSYNGANGTFKARQSISTLPADFKGTSYCAEVQVHPNGKFVYGSNRGHNSIAIFKYSGGKLTLVGTESTRGDWPRNFTIDPTGKFLLAANQNSGTVAVFRIDGKTGKLKPVGDTVSVPSAVCIRFLK